jgi:hypothetical protein
LGLWIILSGFRIHETFWTIEAHSESSQKSWPIFHSGKMATLKLGAGRQSIFKGNELKFSIGWYQMPNHD